MTKSNSQEEQQGDWLKALLRDIVFPPSCDGKTCRYNWLSFEDGLLASFYADNGRPACPVHLI